MDQHSVLILVTKLLMCTLKYGDFQHSVYLSISWLSSECIALFSIFSYTIVATTFLSLLNLMTHTHTYSTWMWCRDHRVFLLEFYSCWHHPDPSLSHHHHHDQQNLQSVWCVGECGPLSLYLIHLHQHCEFHAQIWLEVANCHLQWCETIFISQ